jgi:phytoene desaturase
VKRVAVIGAGLGGLSAAIRLASAGFHVDLYEQNDRAGGKAGSFSMDGFRFDTGPTLLTMPFVIDDLFNAAGRDVNAYLDIVPLRLLTRYFFEDGSIIDAPNDRAALLAELAAKTSETDAVERHLDRAARIYRATADLFLFSSLGEASTFIRRGALAALARLPSIDAHRTMHRANAAAFRDARLVRIFDRYATYNGSNPYRAPATLNIIAHVEHTLGGYSIRGGMHMLPAALARLAEDVGVRCLVNTRVEAITHEAGRVTGIVVDGRSRGYDVVVSNADARVTYEQLLRDTRALMARRYRKAEPSSSALVFFWGMKRTYPALDVHSILFSGDYAAEFADLFERGRCSSDPTVYICVSSKFVPSDAPEGCENWFVMVNTPHDSGQDWAAEAARMRPRIIDKINRLLGEDVERCIVAERMMTPADIERRTGSSHGSIYGISSNSRFSAFLRQQARSRTYRGLYFCGGSAHPGGGIPLCLLSGKIAADIIQSRTARHA